MHSKASGKILKFIKSLPTQIRESKEIVEKTKITIDSKKIKNIHFCGMGGSAFAGDLLLNLYDDQIDVPFQVHRGYHIPKCIHEDSLIIISSYSGNTEETISNFKEAKKHKAQILAITSGGEIADKMTKSNLVIIPEGYPPRHALGYSFFALIYSLEKLGFIEINPDDVEETIQVLGMLARHNDPDVHEHKHFAQTFAQSLHHKIPIIYADEYSFGTLAMRFRNQLNENSKVLAYSNTFPEMNHNEIVGYDMEYELLNKFIFVFLRDPEKEEPRIQLRIKLTKEILRKRKVQVMEIFPDGKSRLARVFSLIYRADWASFYLAILNDKNPLEIKNIDFLKTELNKSGKSK